MNTRRLASMFLLIILWTGAVLIISVRWVGRSWRTIASLRPNASEYVLRRLMERHGKAYVNLTVPSWDYLHAHIQTNLPGGHYIPTTCVPEYRTAIIVPYRDREHQLRCFLQHMHPFLQRQRIEYKIFVVELVPDIPFNRAILMNIGFVESMKSDNFSCFIFHDVDLLPEDNRHLYVCGSSPVHMSVAISQHEYTLPYKEYFGGVNAITRKQFETVNGFSNVYFGWGGEDDDLFVRINQSQMNIVRHDLEISKYRMIPHEKENRSSERFRYLSAAESRIEHEGLNSLRYKLVKFESRPLFTLVLVSVNMTEIRAQWPIPHRRPARPSVRQPVNIGAWKPRVAKHAIYNNIRWRQVNL